MAAGPKEERINLLQEQEDVKEEEELDRVRFGGRLPPKVSSVGSPCFIGSSSYSLKTKISTCADVVAMQKRRMNRMVFVRRTAWRVSCISPVMRKQVPRS